MHDSDLFPSLTLYHIYFYFTPSMFHLFIFIFFPTTFPVFTFLTGSRRICTASVEKINGEWKNIRVGSAIAHTKVKSSIPFPTSPFYPHYERSIECFNSTLNKSERIFNLDPRKAEVCMAEAYFKSDRWTFTAGPTTIWYPRNESSSVSCTDCSSSIDESLPLSQQILPLLIHNGSYWIWKDGRGKISPPSIQFSIEGGDGKTRKPSLQTKWNIERIISTTPSHDHLFIYRPGKEESNREEIGNQTKNIISLTQVSTEDSVNGLIQTELIDGKKKGGISNENSERKTNISAMIREVVWTNSTITQISSTSNGVKNEDPISTTPQFSQLKETIVKSRISAVITSNIDNDLSLFDREEGEESREIRKDYRDRGNESMKEDEEEMKREGKIKMTVVKMERREKTEGASIHIPHQMEILRMGVIIGFISISIIIIVFTLIITMLGRRLNSTTSRDNLFSSDSKRNETARF
ncbi:hypothetical protein PRIPAC_84656 [Pristionchus pacificus]|uniref:Uncharacterized protein n=1 Tax=Pristionchus pacificus TaxID=54126 RepID=A0A2A6BN60_PRIPA|nr:hypothetical protein PRIPAC_84656 [Pristionchus pacificus]|eukprot:PDM67246.1 hypothetical protein PRIPAC_48663 [Pristionchus pacificus]